MLAHHLGEIVGELIVLVFAWLRPVRAKPQVEQSRYADKRGAGDLGILRRDARKSKRRGQGGIGRLDRIEVETDIAQPHLIQGSGVKRVVVGNGELLGIRLIDLAKTWKAGSGKRDGRGGRSIVENHGAPN